MPTKAIMVPTIWIFCIFIFRNKIDSKNVVIIVPPFIIWYTDAEMKFRAMYCRVDDRQSSNAGIINKYLGTFANRPFYIATFYYYSYFCLFFPRYSIYMGNEINIATNIMVAWVIKVLLGHKDEKTIYKKTLNTHIGSSEI